MIRARAGPYIPPSMRERLAQRRSRRRVLARDGKEKTVKVERFFFSVPSVVRRLAMRKFDNFGSEGV